MYHLYMDSINLLEMFMPAVQVQRELYSILQCQTRRFSFYCIFYKYLNHQMFWMERLFLDNVLELENRKHCSSAMVIKCPQEAANVFFYIKKLRILVKASLKIHDHLKFTRSKETQSEHLSSLLNAKNL